MQLGLGQLSSKRREIAGHFPHHTVVAALRRTLSAPCAARTAPSRTRPAFDFAADAGGRWEKPAPPAVPGAYPAFVSAGPAGANLPTEPRPADLPSLRPRP